MSTLKAVNKGFSNIAPPALIGADYASRANEFWMINGPGGMDYKFSYSGHQSSLKAYEKCPPLTAIINKKAKAFLNGRTFIVNKKGKAKDKESTSEVATKLKALRAKPNPFQSERDFDAQQYIYQQLFGYCLMLVIKPVGFANYEATRLWNIPPSMVDIEETRKSWLTAKDKKDVIKKIVLIFGEERAEIPVSDVYIVKDFIPSFKSAIFPESRICALEMPINNIIGAYESRNVLINYRGALGIISPDLKDGAGPVPLKEDEKEALQNDFLRYGLLNQQWKFIISQASVKWSQMGVPTKDLMLFEEIEDDIMRLCDSYDYPYPLMSSNRTNSLGGNNIGESIKLLYQDATIPEAESFCDQWRDIFELDKYDLQFQKNYTHVPALQEDEQKKALARKTFDDAFKIEFDSGLITLNDWLVKLGEDPLPAELGDIRATDVKNSNIPLAVTIGVGGVQGLISVLTAQGMSAESRQATLEIVFGLAPADAQRMAQDNGSSSDSNSGSSQQQTDNQTNTQ
jgi:hypothetical protein